MNKILKSVALVATVWTMIGCSGDNNGTTTLVKAPTIPLTYKVSGSVVDGPIYGAKVLIVDVNDSSIIYGTTSTDENGAFDINISGLPEIYRVLVQDGKDSGVDTQVDSNDENASFDMSATVKREENNETNTSVANVSPATTLVDQIVEDGTMPLEEAQQSVARSFGVDENTSFTKLNMRKHSVGNKVGNLIALLARIAPVEDKKQLLLALVHMIKNKELNVSITDTSVNLEDLNISALLSSLKDIAPENTVSPNDVAKVLSTEALIKTNLIKLLETIKVADTISPEEEKEALSHKIAMDELLKAIEKQSATELNSQVLSLMIENIQKSIKALLDSEDLNVTNQDMIDFVSSMVEENLDANISDIQTHILKASSDYRIIIKKINLNVNIKIKSRVQMMIRLIYKNTKLNNIDKVKDALDDTVLEALSDTVDSIQEESDKIVETGEIPSQLASALEDTIAGQIASDIDNNESNVSAQSIQKHCDDTVKNPLLVETLIEKITINVSLHIKAKTNILTHKDNVKLIINKQVIKTIKINTQVTKFTQVSKDNAKSYETHIENTLNESTVFFDTLRAFNLLLVDLENAFDVDAFKSSTAQTLSIINKIDNDTSVDSVKSISNISVVIKTVFVYETTNINLTLLNIDTEIDNYVKPLVIPTRILSLPQPRLENMPSEFATAIKVEI